MNEAAIYTLVYVLDGGEVKYKQVRGAPPPNKLFSQRPKGAKFGIRLYPSRRAYRVFDLKQIEQMMVTVGAHRLSMPYPRYMIETPDLDAAIMFATLRLT
jgi:hypothetical protein